MQNYDAIHNGRYIKQKLLYFCHSKNTDQDCVDAAAISGTQNSEAIKRKWKAQMFRCSSPQNPLMCDEEDRMRTFPPLGVIKSAQRHAKW